MSLIINGTTIPTNSDYVKVNGVLLDKIYANGTLVWDKVKNYYVQFNGNGATSGSMGTQAFLPNTAQTLTANAFARTGYVFLGWSTSSSAITPTYTNGQSVSNLTTTVGATVTLYAVWKATSLIIYNSNTSFSYYTINRTATVNNTNYLSSIGNLAFARKHGGKGTDDSGTLTAFTLTSLALSHYSNMEITFSYCAYNNYGETSVYYNGSILTTNQPGAAVADFTKTQTIATTGNYRAYAQNNSSESTWQSYCGILVKTIRLY